RGRSDDHEGDRGQQQGQPPPHRSSSPVGAPRLGPRGRQDGYMTKASALSPGARDRALTALAATPADGELDVLVVGGGIVGAGTALDAVTRGLATGLIEQRDLASGT